MDVVELRTSFSRLLAMLQGPLQNASTCPFELRDRIGRWLGQITAVVCVSLQCCLMPLLDHSSMMDITKALEEIVRQRRCIRFLHADKDAADIAGCGQKLKQYVDNFLVSCLVVSVWSVPEVPAIVRDNDDDRDISSEDGQ